ncbi:hypothetical protein H072_1287 [Dactylellina haptotyla CBS 200.50]|uniref:Uncharacterized protein n=1 Tax=Dactylellina haptotyla (strain CBS 200.50) TaxID=1284197 RepID=S8BZ21_DACHA|nr:hypothetical protein H072_1287 [Dactylellina haptotyla CBS 200.50]
MTTHPTPPPPSLQAPPPPPLPANIDIHPVSVELDDPSGIRNVTCRGALLKYRLRVRTFTYTSSIIIHLFHFFIHLVPTPILARMSAAATPRPPPLPTRTPSTLSVSELIPVETALENLNNAAVELAKTGDHITFSTVLDLHTTKAYNRYTFAEQDKFLQGLEVLFEQNSELASDIAWDTIPLLLKFAAIQVDRESEDAEDQKAVVVRANLLLDSCATVGNSKEVFLVITGRIKNLDFRATEDEDPDMEDDDDDDETGVTAPKQRFSPTALATAKILLRLLVMVQKRLKMNTPSKFLASSLMGLLSMTTKASRSLLTTPLCDIMDQIIEFVTSLTPDMKSSDPDVPIQVKLIQAFITHGIEAFLTLPGDNATMIGWSSAWDKKIRPEKVVPKHGTGGGHAHPGLPGLENAQDKLAVGEVLVAFLTLSDAVDMDLESLLQTCLNANIEENEEPEGPEEPGSPTAPTSAEEIPLSYVGSLLLFAGKLSRKVLKGEDLSPLQLKIFPEHANLTSKYLPEGVEGSVIDALVFIGSWIIRHNKKEGDIAELGNIPSEDDDFFLYLQKYSALSATSSEPDLRALTFLHVTTMLHLNPREELRLAFIKDTLEHCPFEALKAAIIGYLKDEVLAASREKSAESIFFSPLILDSLLLNLFPDYEEELLKRPLRDGWVRFNEAYSTISATANLYYLLWANDELRNTLSVARPDWTAEIQRRWVDIIKKAVALFKSASAVDSTGDADLKKEIQSSSIDLEMLSYLLDRLDEIRQQKS